MVDYRKLDLIYPNKNQKIIYLFETFLEKVNNPDTFNLRNRDLDTLRVVREFLNAADFSMCEQLTASVMVSGNYYQHRHGLYVCWRDMNNAYKESARLLAMLVCGELNTHTGNCVIELSKDIYVSVGIDAVMEDRIEKVKVFDAIAEMWRLFMGYENKEVKNICFKNEQLSLPYVKLENINKEVVAHYSELGLDELDIDIANEIIESWCDGEASLNNFVLLTTQPLYTQTMQEDGLIGSFVAKENRGKSLYTELLSKCYRKVGNFQHKILSDKGYLFQDLMASIIRNGKDFAVFQETDGMSSTSMSALKPLVTYTDRIPARMFGSKTFEAPYHGSIILTSNYVNDLDYTSDIKKRLINIKFKYSTLVFEYAEWMKTVKGATSILVACLKKRAHLLTGGYKTGEQLKQEVDVTIADSVVDTSAALVLKSYFDEKGYLTGKELGAIFNNVRGKNIDSVIRNYGLMRVRKSNGMVYKPDTSTGVFAAVLASTLADGTLIKFPLTKYSLTQTDNEFVTFDPMDVNELILDLDANDYKLWVADKDWFKEHHHVKHIVSDMNNQTMRDVSIKYNKIIIDYDKFPAGTTFEQVRDSLTTVMGNTWFAIWETASSNYLNLRVRVMVLLSQPLLNETWDSAVAELDRIIGAVHDSSCRPYHKQALVIPWLKYHFNPQSIGWTPELNEELIEKKNISRLGGIPTEKPENFQILRQVFIDHVEFMSEQIDEYDFWMRTYLMPLSRYVVYDKSITKQQAEDLIELTGRNFGEKMNNRRLLKDAIRRRAGLDIYEQYSSSIMEFYSLDGSDYSSKGFWFPEPVKPLTNEDLLGEPEQVNIGYSTIEEYFMDDLWYPQNKEVSNEDFL